MKDSIREITKIPELTMGLDLGDKFSYYCIIDKSGKIVEEGRVKTQRRAMERFFKSQPKCGWCWKREPTLGGCKR